MTRKRRQSADLPLFDLPLQPDPEPAAEDPGAHQPAAATGPSVLYDEEDAADAAESATDAAESAADGAAQLQLIEPGTGTEPAEAERAASDEAAPEDEALVGDRLLGGLADLAAQLLMLGLAVAASHALGVAVDATDWLPFAVLALAFSFLYWVVPLAFWGQTPGMSWVGHTARAAEGEPLTFGQTFRRWLGALLTLALAGTPLLLAFTGRSLTDRLSGSYTVVE